MSLLHPQTRKAQRRLSTATVLLRQLDCELAQDVSRVAAERAKQTAVAIHHDEAVPVSGPFFSASGFAVINVCSCVTQN